MSSTPDRGMPLRRPLIGGKLVAMAVHPGACRLHVSTIKSQHIAAIFALRRGRRDIRCVMTAATAPIAANLGEPRINHDISTTIFEAIN